MAQIILLINPIAGSGKARQQAPRVMANLRSQGWDVKAVAPTSEAATVSYVKGLPAGTVVAALGGDGFLARVCEGAYHSGAHVIPLPGGRGNDMCRALGVAKKLQDAVRAVPALRPRKIDVGMAGGKLFLGTVYVGFDSEASERANQFKHLTGPLVYPVAAALKLMSVKHPFDFTIAVDGEVIKRKAWLADVCNSGRYGGGMQMSTESEVDDGQLELVTLWAKSRAAFLKVLLAAFSGKILSQSGVKWQRGKSFKLESTHPLVAYADGDRIGPLPLDISIKPSSVTVLVP